MNIKKKKKDIIIEEDCREIMYKIPIRTLAKKKILVTGATGLLGRYIVRTLAIGNRIYNLNCRIDAISRSVPRIDKIFAHEYNVLHIKKDLAKPFKIKNKYDVIFHAAGYGQPAKFVSNPEATTRINVDATLQLLDVAKKSNGIFIFFSSAEIYGEMMPGMESASEEYQGLLSTSNPRAVYGEAKRLAETLIATHVRQHGTQAKIVRISHTYGPGITYADSRVFGDFMRKAVQDGKITMLDAGASTKTYGYIADVITMILTVALKGGEMVYNVGGKNSASIKELAQVIARLAGATVETPKDQSKKVHIGHDPSVVRLDLSRVMRLNKKITFTPLEEGLRRMIEWNKNQK